MLSDQFEIHNCLTMLEVEINARMETEEKEAAMELGHEILYYPEFVPHNMVLNWSEAGRGRR